MTNASALLGTGAAGVTATCRVAGSSHHRPSVKKRILVLTPRLPYPPVGGDRLRIYEICRHLSAEFELSLLTMCDSEEDMERLIPEDGIFVRVDRVLHSSLRRLVGSFAAVASRNPIQVGYYHNRAFARRLRELAPSHDALLAHLIRTGSYITDYRLPRIVEMTDAISLAYARTAKQTRWLRSALYQMEARRLVRYERAIVENCDLAVLVSPVDRDYLFPAGNGLNLMVCSNGVDTRRIPFRFSPDGRTIIFIGKNIAHYNVDGIRYFSEQIFPLVKARRPDAQFKVIGQIRSEFREKLERRGILVTGSVKCVAEAARNASVAVCPLRIGAGVQNKLLEYMAIGIPAITSSIGLEGLNAIPDVHLMTAAAPSDWAEKICHLLHDRKRAETLALAGREFVEGHHSWHALIAPLTSAISELTSSHTQTR